MSFSQCLKQQGLPREVLKWLQSLDLSFYPKNVRRDFSSGYLVAEIFSFYYPQDFHVHSFDKGTSLSAKQRNWSQIERSLQKQNHHLMKEVIDGTIHCKPGAAELLVLQIYSILTNRSIRSVQSPESDFTDKQYQDQLPTLARSTASQAIKNNLRTTEIMAEPDITTNQRKAMGILLRHLQYDSAGRIPNLVRFKVNPNLGHLAAKNPGSRSDGRFDSHSTRATASKSCSSSLRSAAVASFKEIKVSQPVRRSLLN
ncbi:spermatogenesis-associated protein 4 [Cheilinus undulatus]|uniref:spermatogenesis-associated protein 4 n=1 Tax=Cheilinus undulatus TaxID=241271 RepID=UPI001BD60BDD|nr:spermatogenesis-associated protein 4 [Cheilinus undulatus]